MSITSLRTTYPVSGDTLYAVIRQADSPYSAWNGTALETWDDANIATYAVALADQGGDLYAADVPADLPVGTYIIKYYVQDGADPAITDLGIGAGDKTWNGAALVVPDTDTILSPYALTTLASFKAHAGIAADTDDDKIVFLINAASAEIERITGTNFLARDYVKRLNGFRQNKLILRRPIQRLDTLQYSICDALRVGYSGSAIVASVSVQLDPESPAGGKVILRTVSSVGVTTRTELSFATYPTTALMATAIGAVSGWTATASRTVPSAWLDPIAAGSVLGGSVSLTYPEQLFTVPFTVDYERGIVTFDERYWAQFWGGWQHGGRRFPQSHQGVLIEYRAGWEAVPGDVQNLANALVQQFYEQGNVDPMMKSETIGDYTYVLNTDATKMIRSRLTYYIDGAAMIGGVR